MKKSPGMFLGLVTIICCVVGWILLRQLVFHNTARLREINHECMQIKPGVKIEELVHLFGSPQHFKEDGYERYLFGSYEYSVLYSDYIVAEVSGEGQITDFRCGERMFPWK